MKHQLAGGTSVQLPLLRSTKATPEVLKYNNSTATTRLRFYHQEAGGCCQLGSTSFEINPNFSRTYLTAPRRESVLEHLRPCAVLWTTTQREGRRTTETTRANMGIRTVNAIGEQRALNLMRRVLSTTLGKRVGIRLVASCRYCCTLSPSRDGLYLKLFSPPHSLPPLWLVQPRPSLAPFPSSADVYIPRRNRQGEQRFGERRR